MPALEILPSEIAPKFGIDVKPRPGDLRGWAAYRARNPKPALPAPSSTPCADSSSSSKPKYAPIPKHLFKPKPEAAPARKQYEPLPIPADMQESADRILGETRASSVNKIRRIIAEVAREFGIAPHEIMSHRRHVSVAIPRHFAIYIAKRKTTRSLPEIAYLFSGRDHTTIINSIRQSVKMMALDPALSERIQAIEARIDANV